MSKIIVELTEGHFQYATQIDSRLPLSKNNIGYSIYHNRAIDGCFIDQVRQILPDFTFKVEDNNG